MYLPTLPKREISQTIGKVLTVTAACAKPIAANITYSMGEKVRAPTEP